MIVAWVAVNGCPKHPPTKGAISICDAEIPTAAWKTHAPALPMLSEPLLDDKAPSAASCLSARGVLFTIVSAVALVGAGCFSLANTLLSGGFSGGGGGGACGDRESCLGIVDAFLLHQPRQSYFSRPHVGLIQTFGPDSVGGGPCGDEMCKLVEPCPNYAQTPHCRYDVYDNALAAIYLTKRGQIEEARKILDAFIELLYPPHPCAPQPFYPVHTYTHAPDPFFRALWCLQNPRHQH